MKQIYLFILFFLIGYALMAQVSISTDGSAADNSTLLEVKSKAKGFLPPRMTRAELNTISLPVDGLVAFCTDCNSNGTGALVVYKGGTWLLLSPNCVTPFAPVAATHTPSPTQIVWNWNAVTGAAGYKWNAVNDYASATEMGTTTSMTQTGLNCYTAYTSFVWAYTACGNSTGDTLRQTTSMSPPASPVAATHAPSVNQIIWNWNTVSNSNGYKWNTSNNYATATDLGNSSTKTETGLACNTSYTRYLWAYSSCGVSSPITITQTTVSNPTTPTASTSSPSPTQIIWNWNAVSGASGYKWNTTNNYGTATDLGSAISKTETGLNCSTTYNRYVWAYTACGNSSALTLTQATSLNPPPTPLAATHVPATTQIVWNWNSSIGATGYKWSDLNNFASATDMGAATTKTEIGLSCNTPYTRFVWAYNSCGNSTSATLTSSTSFTPAPSTPTSATPATTITQIVWNWNAASGATGYKWNTTNNLGTAIEMGTSLTKTETGLTCNSNYNRYVWAYNECGYSTSAALLASTNQDPPATPSAGTHVPSPTKIVWNWNTVVNAAGYKWNTTNSLASAIDMGTATARTDSNLVCNTSYNSYVWAYNNCGISTPVALSQTTSMHPPDSPLPATNISTTNQITWNWNVIPGVTGYKWNSVDDYATATNMGISTSYAQTGLNCYSNYYSHVWAYNSCGVSISRTLNFSTTASPPAPVAGTHIASTNQIIWNWSAVPEATAYKWNTVNNFATATNIGTATSKTEIGLNCTTPYNRYVWAINNCGNSSVVTLNQSTVSCWVCGDPMTLTHTVGDVAPVTKTTTYGTVSSTTIYGTKCWITSNLGSDHQATAVNDATEPSAGWYWQFDHKQGYKHDGVNRTPNTTWTTWYTDNNDWTMANDPCTILLGSTWRMPTNEEWQSLDNYWSNWNDTWNSSLKLHAAGYISYDAATLTSIGFQGFYWSSTASTNNQSSYLFFNSNTSNINTIPRSTGIPVRCIKD